MSQGQHEHLASAHAGNDADAHGDDDADVVQTAKLQARAGLPALLTAFLLLGQLAVGEGLFTVHDPEQVLCLLASERAACGLVAAGAETKRQGFFEIQLAGLCEIVIDPVQCPLTYQESTAKEFMRDGDGRWLDEIPDGGNHSIDAVRYAMMDDVLRG